MGSVRKLKKADTFNEEARELTAWMVQYETLQEIQDYLKQTYKTDEAPSLEDIEDILVAAYRLGYLEFGEN